jgi:hypothetical protein
MRDSVLLLAPVAILAVVLLLGFLGCDGWPGVGGPGEDQQSQLTLDAKAPEAGPGVKAITSASFTVTGPLGSFPGQPDTTSTILTATKIYDTLWEAVHLFATAPQLGPTWTIIPYILIDPGDGTTREVVPDMPFEKEWTGAKMSWSFCVNYDPGVEGTGEFVYTVVEC